MQGMRIPRPLALIILDGLGISPEYEGNAVALAQTPVLDRLFKECPNSQLLAHGEAVGLLPGQMGNSNVGHLNLGAGRVVYQDLVRINRSIRSGEMFRHPEIVKAMENAVEGRALHLMGLVSDGGVHSHQDHLHALLDLAASKGCSRVYVHCFLDGRDVAPVSAGVFLERLKDKMAQLGTGQIATVMGRFYAMDRDGRWDRTALAYRALVLGEGLRASSAQEALKAAYDRGETDEFVTPTVIMPPSEGGRLMNKGDSVVFFNFRADRARQISRALVERNFLKFKRPGGSPGLRFLGMSMYDEDLEAPYVFPRLVLTNTFGEVVSGRGLSQLRIAETEKYAHVTYFFNGGKEEPFPGEDRILIPSPRVSTYDQKPEMSAFEVTNASINQIESGRYDVIILNYANPDMVGHTGILKVAIKAVEVVDTCLGRVLNELGKVGGAALVVSDHGNAEMMLETEGHKRHTAHTSNPVPCILVGCSHVKGLGNGMLSNVAPTLLRLMGIPIPEEMDCPLRIDCG